MEKELLTIPEFCQAANVGRTVAYRLINERRVHAVKLGKKTLISRQALENFISDLQPYFAEKQEA